MAQPALFVLPDRAARAVALGVMGTLGATRAGRAMIDFMGHMHASPELAVRVDGVVFSSPFGIGWRVDPECRATRALERFGVGCIERRNGSTGAGMRSVVRGEGRCLRDSRLEEPRAGKLARAEPERGGTVNFLVRRELVNGGEAVVLPSGLTLPVVAWTDALPGETTGAGNLENSAEKYCAATDATDATDGAAMRGVVLQVGERMPLAEGGGWRVPVEMPDALPEKVRAWRRRLGPDGVVIVAGGVGGPADGVALVEAGASLVLIDAGLVFNGPGLVKRCNAALLLRKSDAGGVDERGRRGGIEGERECEGRAEARNENLDTTGCVVAGAGLAERPRLEVDGDLRAPSVFSGALDSRPARINGARISPSTSIENAVPLMRRAWFWAAALGVALAGGGVLALVLSFTRVLLPYDEHFLGLTADFLKRNSPKLHAFMAHDRGTLAGVMIGLGWLYLVVSWRGIRGGIDGAKTAVVASALAGFASFFSFLGFGYFDTLHAFVAAILFQLTVQLMVGVAGGGVMVVGERDDEDAGWRRAQWGQFLWVIHAVGLLIAGCVILAIGMTRVFVGEDLAFLCMDAGQVSALGERVVSVVAHDRATLGGMLWASGVGMLLPVLWCHQRGARWLWWAIAGLGAPAYGATLGMHTWVGYTDWRHIVPAVAGLALWAGGLVLSRVYLWGGKHD